MSRTSKILKQMEGYLDTWTSKDVKMTSRNKNRLKEIIQKGDIVEGYAFTSQSSGFIAKLEIRAVAHWGVYAVVKDEKELRNYNDEHRKKIMKRQFLIKWCNIKQFFLK